MRGVTVAGYLDASHSIGETARLAIATVKAAGIPLQSVVYSAGKMSRVADTPNARRSDYDTNLVVVNADQFADFAALRRERLLRGSLHDRSVGLGGRGVPRALARSVRSVGRGVGTFGVLAASRFKLATDKPVFASPPPVLLPEIAPEIGRPELGLPGDRYVFLFCLDLRSVVERKNPVGAIEAFKQAFSPGEGPVLVVKTTNGDSREMDLEMVRYAASGRADVVVMDGDFPRPRLGSLMAAADCYVSLHRSEGFGLTMAESMALGKPVIATAYSGNLEFMTDENSFLVPFSWSAGPGRSRALSGGRQVGRT